MTLQASMTFIDFAWARKSRHTDRFTGFNVHRQVIRRNQSMVLAG